MRREHLPMTTLHTTSMIAREHAIVLSRDLRVPAGKAATLLPCAAKHLADELSLIVRGAGMAALTRPIELLLKPSAQTSDWQIELRLSPHAGGADFFEGALRLENLPPRSTRGMLLGRLAFPRDTVLDQLNEAALRDLAEDNVIRAFERLLLDIESAPAATSREEGR